MMLMAAFLLIPEHRRFVQFCLGNCAVEGPSTRRLFAWKRANRIAVAAQIAFGLSLLATSFYTARENWSKYSGGATKSALYGIWNVDEMSIDGVVRSPLLTDYERWRRVIFDSPQRMAFQRMDDSFGGFAMAFDPKRHTIALNKQGDQKWRGEFAVHLQNARRMTVDGRLGQHTIRLQLSLLDRDKFLLVSRGFHWIQDYPFIR
jgi:hypothetical protein